MDDRIDQRDGFRFIYSLPMERRRVLVEDTEGFAPAKSGACRKRSFRPFPESIAIRTGQAADAIPDLSAVLSSPRQVRHRAGDRAYVYRDAGYTFDAGPTVITAPHCLEELFELGATPFLNFRDMIRCAPDLMRLRADRSVYATVSRFIKHEQLRQAFSFHPLLVGGNPMETSAIYTLIHWIERRWGVFFPRGGTGLSCQRWSLYSNASVGN